MPAKRDEPARAWTRHRRIVRAGQALMALGALIVVVHLVAHLTSSPSGWTDLTIGYPTGAGLGLLGVVLAGRAQPRGRG